MSKKIGKYLGPVFVLAFLLCLKIDTEAAIYTGSCGTNISWEINSSTGQMYIYGKGAVNVSDVVQEAPWYSYKSYVTSLVIGEGITELGAGAVYEFPYLLQVSLPETLTAIGDYAFDGCVNLRTIQFPNNLRTIGNAAFYMCKSLTEISLPENVVEFEPGIFASCTSLKKVEIKGNITSLPDAFFNSCTSLNSVSLPKSLKKIGTAVFDNCSSLETITLPDSIVEFGESVFGGCSSLKNVTLPSNLTTIGNTTFGGCTSLKTVNIPKQLFFIPTYTFYGCTSLEELSIPQKTIVSADAFYNIPSFFVMYGYSGSSAETAAKEKNLTFVAYDDVNQYNIQLSQKSFVYSGEEMKPNIIVYFHNEKLTEGTDYQTAFNQNKNAGIATVTVKGLTPYQFSIEKEFIIHALSLENAVVSIENTLSVYDGTEKCPKICVEMNGIFLKENKDYKVSYTNCINAGWGNIQIIGIGNYKGICERKYRIEKKNQLLEAVSLTKTYGSRPFNLPLKKEDGSQLVFESSNKKVAIIDNLGKVTLKGCGETRITIVAVATQNKKEARIQITLTILPKKAILKTIAVKKGGKGTVFWKKDNKVTGYQIVYSLDKKFKSSKTINIGATKTDGKYTFTKLRKGKIYYIHMRQYKKVGKKVYYGMWSKTMRFRAK